VVENVIWGEGLAKNVNIPSYGGKRSKIAQKKRRMIFERSLKYEGFENNYWD